MDASLLLNRPAEVTRSTVQKAVVVIADSPQFFGMLRERLSVVTSAWFAQREFTDCEILRRFQESLKEEKERGQLNEEEDRDQYLGMSLRELVREFKWQTLVLLKCCLLQPKVWYSSTRNWNGSIPDAFYHFDQILVRGFVPKAADLAPQAYHFLSFGVLTCDIHRCSSSAHAANVCV